MNQEIKQELINNLDDVYSKIIDNNKESEEINKKLSLIDELQNEINFLFWVENNCE